MARFSLVPQDRVFFDLFAEAGQNTLRSAKLLRDMLQGWPEDKGLGRDLLKAEQEGDRITHDIIQRLNTTFVTPIDREDIYALATQLDDIVDYIEEAADFMGLYKIEAPMDQALDAGRGPGQGLRAALRRCCRTCAASRTWSTTGSRSTGSRTTVTGSIATRWPRCSPTGSTRWS